MASFTQFALFDLPAGTPVRAYFPGAAAVSDATYGYVRSSVRAEHIAAARKEKPRLDVPWRDYGMDVRCAADVLARSEGQKHTMFIGARNVLNEFGFRLRLNGFWFGRAGDPPLDSCWPVVALAESGPSFHRLGSLPEASDILTGLPLVIDGRPVSRSFVVANCSDPAHAYEVHPKGLIGPSAEAWHDLADAWEVGKQNGLDDEAIFARIEAVAERHRAKPSRNILHSVLGGRVDGSVLCAAITGSLTDIASGLVALGIEQAIVLDNGGSVGWYYCPEGRAEPVVVVAGPNHRPSGTVFIAFDLGSFPQPVSHPLLAGHWLGGK